MYCSHCGMKLPNWAHYCERCGTRVRRMPRRASSRAHVTRGDVPQQLRASEADAARQQAEGFKGGYETDPRGADLGFTVNDAIRRELDNLSEPLSLDDLERFTWPVPREEISSQEPAEQDALVQEPVAVAKQAPEPIEADFDEELQLADEGAADRPLSDVELEAEAPEDVIEAEDAQEAAEGDLADAEAELPEEAEELGQERLEDQAEELASKDEAGIVGDELSPEDASAEYSEPDFWSTLQFEKIDVGEDDRPTEAYVPTYHRNAEDRRRIQETFAHPRHRERRSERSSTLSKVLVTAVTTSAIGLSVMLTYPMLNWAMQGRQPVEQEEPETTVQLVSRRRAKKIVRNLEGWWTTNRTFDGRFWQIEGGELRTYAADGNLTKMRKIELDKIEVVGDEVEGLEDKGYYLQSINYYLLDADPDTLLGVDTEGKLDEDANLHRIEEPTFVEKKKDEKDKK